VTTAFIDDHREGCGVEPMCKILQIVPSNWHEHARRKASPDPRSARANEDGRPCKEINRVQTTRFGTYGARWAALCSSYASPLAKDSHFGLFNISCRDVGNQPGRLVRMAWTFRYPGHVLTRVDSR
jgi:hypothetical protein